MRKAFSALFLSALLAVSVVAFQDHTAHQNDSNQTITKSDGSVVITTIAEDGTRTQVRTFKSGNIAKVTRTTNPDGSRMVVVEYRDGREADLKDKSDIEQAMDATADKIEIAANKALNATAKVGEEVADKTEDVVDKTADVTKQVASETKEIGEKTADKTKDVAKDVATKTEVVANKAVDKSKETAGEVVDKTVDTSKDVARSSVKGVKVVGDKAEDVADATVDTSKDVAREGSEKAKQGGSWAKRGVKKIGGWFKNIFD
jgi:hypothetical protein